MRLRTLTSYLPLWDVAGLALLALLLMLVSALDNEPAHSGEVLKSLGLLSGLGRILGGGLGRGAVLGGRTVRTPTFTTPTTRAVVPFRGAGGSTAGSLARRAGLIAGGGAAFELGMRALPGGASFPGGSRGGGGGGGFGGPASAQDLQPGAPFGDSWITRVWSTGETAEGVPIIHGLLANRKRFATDRNGTIKVFRPRKSIVIGPDPRLSDARQVARAAKKMEKAATQILSVTGKKAVRRG